MTWFTCVLGAALVSTAPATTLQSKPCIKRMVVVRDATAGFDREADSSQVVVYYLLFLNGLPGKTPTPEVLARHAAHLAELDRQGKLVLAGPFLGRFAGLLVLRTTLAEAKQIADEDPMIRGGFQSYDLVAWAQADKRNSYQPNLARVAGP